MIANIDRSRPVVLYRSWMDYALAGDVPNAASEVLNLDDDCYNLAAFRNRQVYIWREAFKKPDAGWFALIDELEDAGAQVLSAEELVYLLAGSSQAAAS